MSSTTAMNDLPARRGGRGHPRSTRRWLAVAVLALVAACGVDTAGPDDAAAPCVPPAAGSAPTYTELYTKYFAAKTPGHCATAECHLDGVQGWTCGLSKSTCYAGMVSVGIIDLKTPTASVIGDPRFSPLRWINPNGPMPQDTPGPFLEGKNAIQAWVAQCAQNN